MARETVYEGPDLQQLLQRVIDERGPARIRPPERRRRGGLFGFFAKEVYVITVDDAAPADASDDGAVPASAGDVDAPMPASAPLDAQRERRAEVEAAAGTHAPAALSGLPSDLAGAMAHARAAMAGDAPSATLPAARGSDDPWAASTAGAPVSPFTSRRSVVTSPLRALVEATEDEAALSTLSPDGGASEGGEGSASGGDGAGAFEGGEVSAQIATMPTHAERPLRRVVGSDLADETSTSPDPRPARPQHKPFREVLSEVASSLGEEPGAYRPDPAKLQPARRPTAVRPLDLADVPRASAAENMPEAARRGRVPRAATAAQLSLVGLDDLAAVAPGTPTTPGTPTSATVIASGPSAPLIEETPATTTTTTSTTRDEPTGLDATIVELLRAAGFPDTLLPRAALDPDRPLLEAVFASLPAPPPLPGDPGGLVAVVGAAGMVRPTAQAIALAVGCPEDEVVVASPSASDRHARAECRARNAAQAAALHPGWRRDKVAVVAVYAPPMGTTQRWTREILHALRPSCVWGMAGATTKPDDIGRWVGAIGGVDALVVTEIDSTATPASILSLGVPIACLDEEPATPERWAAVVAGLVTKH